MLFNSHVFLFAFLPVTLLVFFALGRFGRRNAAILWLTAASLLFYGWLEPRNVILIGASMLWNFALGRVLGNSKIPVAVRRVLLAAGIAGNLAVLGYFKYSNFLVDNINGLFGSAFALHSIALPLGISFFTFQQLSYLVDAYRGQTREHNLVNYCLFVTFFPQLIAGPIVHHGEILPQFEQSSVFRLRRRNLEAGMAIFFIGLFKKVVIADSVAGYASPVFAAAAGGAPLGFLEAWSGALAYTLQLYFDFSAYSDMAIGLGMLFGIRIPINFNSPYKACNMIEFWRRWHMTLSRFLRDYVYISLGGNRHGAARRHVNLFLTMLLGGLWHGAGWTFIIWGGLHGLYLAINHACQTARGRYFPARVTAPAWERVLARAVTFKAVVAGWVLFRAADLSTAGSILHSMAGLGGIALPENLLGAARHVPGLVGTLDAIGVGFAPLPYFSGAAEVAMLAGLLGLVWLAPNTQEIMRRVAPGVEKVPSDEPWQYPAWLQWRPTNGWAIAMSVVTVISVMHLSRISEFLYFQF